jgi:hypothetical protein
VFLSDGIKKTLQKRFTKSACRKVLQKNRQKNPKCFWFSFFWYSCFCLFLSEGSSKTPLKEYQEKKMTLVLSLASDPPTHHGGPPFVLFWRLLGFVFGTISASPHY